MNEQPSYSPGLAGVIAGETAIACVEQGRLLYRGYPIHELAEKATFEEVAHLLLYDELPGYAALERIKEDLFRYRPLSPTLVEILRRIPQQVPMMDVLRTCVSAAGHFCPVTPKNSDELRQLALYLTAQISAIIAARYRLLNGWEPIEPKPGLSHAAQLLYQCHGEVPDPLSAELIDLTLILYAEHDFNASTFTARVICSTGSDLVSAVVGAIGALKGPLHGGANEAAMQMLLQFKTAEEATKWVREALARKEKIMGFGHRIYKHGDHRADILEGKMRKLAHMKKAEHWLEIYDAIKYPMVHEKHIFPNVDYPCGLVYYLLGLPLDMYTPLFVASRITGWSAHYIEQSLDNKLYRPISLYVGHGERHVPPMDER